MYGKKLRELRNLEAWTQEEVSKKLGVSKQTYSHYENEKRKPSLDMVHKLADVYGVDLNTVFGTNGSSKNVKEGPEKYYSDSSKFKRLPIVGRISHDEDIVSYEEVQGYEDIPSSWLSEDEYFLFRASDNSMINARIQKDDLLLIKRQNTIENGEISVVYIDGSAVLKRIYETDSAIILQSENPKYPPISIEYDKKIKVIGKLKLVILTF